MYYRIADLTVCSQLRLPSFEAFACEPAAADVTLEWTEERPPAGKELVSGSIVHRFLPDGWFCHGREGENQGLMISGDYTRLRFTGADKSGSVYQAERFVRVALECMLIRRGCVSLHAAAVEKDGAAFLFCGPSGLGKSTRARAWMNELGAQLISGDRPLIRLEGMEVFGVPWDGKEQCHRNVHYPLEAICDIRRAASVRVREMSFSQRMSMLMRQCFLPMWDSDTAAMQMRNIFRLLSGAQIVRAFCGPTEKDAAGLYAAIGRKEFLREAADMKAKSGFVLKNTSKGCLLTPAEDSIGAFDGSVLLNETSAFIWEQLQSPISREDLLRAILDEFQVDEAAASADLDKLLKTLKSYQLLEGD